MNEIDQWLTSLGACTEGKTWAVENCKTKQEVWDFARPEWLVWLATQKGVVDEKTQHFFACWCVRQVWHLLIDERSRKAVETKEYWIDGLATDEELAAAGAAAGAAASDAASDAAATWAAARAVARAAASDAAAAAASDAAAAATWAAASDAAAAATWAAAWAAARAAARAAQAKWLRDNVHPNLEVSK